MPRGHISLLLPLAPESPFATQQSEGSLRKVTQSMSTPRLPTGLPVTEKPSPRHFGFCLMLRCFVLASSLVPPDQSHSCSLKMPSRFPFRRPPPLQPNTCCRNVPPLQFRVAASSTPLNLRSKQHLSGRPSGTMEPKIAPSCAPSLALFIDFLTFIFTYNDVGAYSSSCPTGMKCKLLEGRDHRIFSTNSPMVGT